jgi:hypothetical protein
LLQLQEPGEPTRNFPYNQRTEQSIEEEKSWRNKGRERMPAIGNIKNKVQHLLV